MLPSHKTTLSQDIQTAQKLAFYPALTVIVITRRNIGYRLLRPVTLIALFCVLTLFAANGNNQKYHPEHLFCFAIVMLLVGLYQRIDRWRNIVKGEAAEHTLYVGTSWLQTPRSPHWLIYHRRITRFIEPTIICIIGLVIFGNSPMLGAWLLFAGFCVAVHEDGAFRRDFHRRIDVSDGLIESEIQGRYAEHFSEQKSPTQNPSNEAGLPTGIGPDIEEKIKKNHTKQFVKN